MTLIQFLLVWFIVSIPVSLFVGKFIAVGQARRYEGEDEL